MTHNAGEQDLREFQSMTAAERELKTDVAVKVES